MPEAIRHKIEDAVGPVFQESVLRTAETRIVEDLTKGIEQAERVKKAEQTIVATKDERSERQVKAHNKDRRKRVREVEDILDVLDLEHAAHERE